MRPLKTALKKVLAGIFTLILVGCGSSSTDDVISTLPMNGVGAGALRFTFTRPGAQALAVPAETTTVDFTFFSTNDDIVLELTRHYADTITVTEVPTTATRVRLTTCDTDGVGLTTIDSEITVLDDDTVNVDLSRAVVAPVIPADDVVRLVLEPEGAAVPNGGTQSFRVMALLTDGSSKDITTQARWSSSAPQIASLAANVATGRKPGQATIRAAFSGRSVSAPLVVTPFRDGGRSAGFRETTLESLTLTTDTTLNTDTGMLTPTGAGAAIAPGYNAAEHQLLLENFTLKSGTTMTVTGSAALTIVTKSSIDIKGTIRFIGSDGVPGEPFWTGTRSGGTSGSAGGNVSLLAMKDLTITGTIDTHGGNGGNGVDVIFVTSGTKIINAGNGGQGGAAGSITLWAGGLKAVTEGALEAQGGNGGNGGKIMLSSADISDAGSDQLKGGAGGHGGFGSTQGGAGGAGGSVRASGTSEKRFKLSVWMGGAGGNGGGSHKQGGNGGAGGDISSEQRLTSTGLPRAGAGGAGGSPNGAPGAKGTVTSP